MSVNILIISRNFAVCIKNYLPWTEIFFMSKTVRWKWHHDFGEAKNATADFYSYGSKVAARCERPALRSHSCLLVSSGGQQRAFSEASVSSLMTCVKVGVQERVNSHTGLGVSQVAPQGSFKDHSGAHSEGPAQQAGAQKKPEPAAEVKEGLSLRLGQKWVFLKEATVRVCAGLWWPHLLTDCSLINIYS